MLTVYYYVVLAVVSVVFFFWQLRRREIFRVEVKHGRARVARGRLPSGMLGELAQVVSSPPVRRATIFAFRGLSGAQLYCSGDLDAGREQRLRNLFSLYPASRLRSAPEPESRSLVEMLSLMLRWLIRR